MKFRFHLAICLAASGLFLVSYFSSATRSDVARAQQIAMAIEPDGGGKFENEPRDEITDADRAVIHEQNRRNMARLEREGKLPTARPEAVPLSWPVRKAPGLPDFNIEGISNFVDQNPAFPNQLLDWNCGARTYDQASGYNHKGIDIFTWPFSWKKMDNNEVEIIAAAPGTIINKFDGNFDRNCGFGAGNWNAVYVRHADNSVAWYGHMKNGSLTPKIVGDSVVTGEKLGIVGSSGNSTGPHLHFELYDAANNLQDPYQGTCNTLNNFSWWAAQEPYRNSRINRLMTQSAGPVFPACPTTETTNEKQVFRPGNLLVTAAYYRDQMLGQQTQHSVLRPDGTTFQAWIHNSPNTYNASYWWWSWTLPMNAQRGNWRFRSTFNAVTYEQTFYVTGSPVFDFDGDGKTDPSVYRPSAGDWYLLNTTTGFRALHFGLPSDIMVPADYTGDGKTDMAVWRPSDSIWYILRSENNTFYGAGFGANGDIPAPGDYDGDGKADLVVIRPGATQSYWFLQQSTAGFAVVPFGLAGDVPTLGDYDGDGKNDVAVYRPSAGAWFRFNSSNGSFLGVGFGTTGDKVVPADYTGDGKTDLAVFRPSNNIWFILRSEDNSLTGGAFGASGDLPSPGDYDGDGKADLAVYRPGPQSVFYLQQSTAGFNAIPWGLAEDRPVPNAYVY